VANSSLVKTSFFGEDFNWGRTMAALGSSGALFDRGKVDIFFNDIQAVRHGEGAEENINRLKKIVKKNSIRVTVDLKNGTKSYGVNTCDLSYEYVKINAEYTT
jgi:glutamate N-acetyltransferase/amino-acid N-acetyltransferase